MLPEPKFGFAKNERDNIDADELKYWLQIGMAFLQMNAAQLTTLIEQDELKEVNCQDEKNVPSSPP